MKKLLSLFLTAVFLVQAGFALAVDKSCALTRFTIDGEDYAVFSGLVLVECTAASDDHSMAYTFGVGYGATGDRFTAVMDGRRVLRAYAYDGAGTDPTANSDLGITDSLGAVLVDPAVNGLNVITNGTDTDFYFLDSAGNNGYPQMHKNMPWTITWPNNIVNSAVHYLLLETTGERYVTW